MSALKFPEDHGQKKLSGNIRLIDVKSQDLMDLGKTVYHSIPVNIQILRRMIDMISRKKILFQTAVKIPACFPVSCRKPVQNPVCVSFFQQLRVAMGTDYLLIVLICGK